MKTLNLPDKDPDEVKDYILDWTDELDGDTISGMPTWVGVPAGITMEDESNTTTTHTIWLSGGTAGESYVFTSRVVTAGGRTCDQRLRIKIRTS
jgi:hypothetical protein